MKIINLSLIFYFIFFFSIVDASNNTFDEWLLTFKIKAKNNGISEKTFDTSMGNVKFLPKVIEYDRYQPEFYEDTLTYIKKRTSTSKIKKGVDLYKNNKNLINSVEKKFNVEKELLLALMGIETNFGKYLGKMDILSSLATLSFDKRRSEFFTNELIIILQLIEKDVIDYESLYGSWAGAYGNFQFMPSTIKDYAIDYNANNRINLKNFDDSFASAANYINKLGWLKNELCYLKINLKDNTPKILLNTSAKKIKNKKKIKYLKKFIHNSENLTLNDNLLAGIITPDKDIVADSKLLEPAYLVFSNYELILKWNRSLRFALAVCELKNKFGNEL
jgi:membrane-bound lytic murein transglycosylase B